MMASLLQMNTPSTSGSGSLPRNTVANPKGELKAITTRSGLVTNGPIVPTPPKSVTPEVGERVEETYTDPDLAEYTIKVPPPSIQKYKPPCQRDFIVHTRDSPFPNIPYPSRMLKPKQQEKDEKMLKALLSNKEKLQELANTPLNENCPAVILKKLPEKLRDPGKFLIPCGFSELKCKSLADLGASINLMPLSVWKELAVFVVVDYKSDPRVPLILGRPFLRTAHALIDVYGEEMILRDGNKRLTLNMKHDTASYFNHPQRESVNLINIFNVSSEDFLEVSVSNKPSGNPTFSFHQELTSPEVTHDIHDSEGCNVLSEKLPDIDSRNDIHPYFDDNPLSGSTTYSSNLLLKEFTDELALITYPLEYDDNLQFDIEFDLREIEFLLYQGKDYNIKDSIVQTDRANFDDYFVDPVPEMFTDEHAPDYSSPPIFDFSRVDAFPSTDNEDKVFNPGILIHEKPVKIITRVVQDKKLAISYASLVFEDFDPPFYEPLFFKDVPKSKMLLPFSSENEEKVFKPGIYTSEKVHSCFLPELSHPGYHVFKVNQIFISLMKIFLVQCRKNTPILDVLLFHFYPPLISSSMGDLVQLSDLKQVLRGRQPMLISERTNKKRTKIRTKPDKNRKRGKAQQCRRPITVEKAEKRRKYKVQGTKDANPKSCIQFKIKTRAEFAIYSKKQFKGQDCQLFKVLKGCKRRESDELIKSSVENLVPIPSESEGIPENMCDVPFHDNSPPLDILKDQYEDFSDSNDDSTSIDDDSFSIDNIEYVEASPPDSELISSEVMEIVISEVGGIDADILLTIKDDILHEKLLNINLLIANIEALKDNPNPYSDFMTKSSSTSLNFLLKETNTFDNSLPKSKTFCFDLEETSSGSTTTRFDISLPDYEAFYDDHVKEISSGSTTTHLDFSLYDSFIFDLSINPFPPVDRSDFYHEEFADELAHIISLPKYDCLCFKNKPNSGDFTMDVVEDIFQQENQEFMCIMFYPPIAPFN
nr:hypothetical protein [Tanacetum cinerariifolium]